MSVTVFDHFSSSTLFSDRVFDIFGGFWLFIELIDFHVQPHYEDAASSLKKESGPTNHILWRWFFRSSWYSNFLFFHSDWFPRKRMRKINGFWNYPIHLLLWNFFFSRTTVEVGIFRIRTAILPGWVTKPQYYGLLDTKLFLWFLFCWNHLNRMVLFYRY